MNKNPDKKPKKKTHLLGIILLVVPFVVIVGFLTYTSLTVESSHIMVKDVQLISLNTQDLFRNNDFNYVLLSSMFSDEGVYFSEYTMSKDCWSCNMTNFPVKISYNNTIMFNMQKYAGLIEPVIYNGTTYFPVESGIIDFSDNTEKKLFYNDSTNSTK